MKRRRSRGSDTRATCGGGRARHPGRCCAIVALHLGREGVGSGAGEVDGSRRKFRLDFVKWEVSREDTGSKKPRLDSGESGSFEGVRGSPLNRGSVLMSISIGILIITTK